MFLVLWQRGFCHYQVLARYLHSGCTLLNLITFSLYFFLTNGLTFLLNLMYLKSKRLHLGLKNSKWKRLHEHKQTL
jgi:hypothetical protein